MLGVIVLSEPAKKGKQETQGVFHSDCNMVRSVVWGNLPVIFYMFYMFMPLFIPVQEVKYSEPQLNAVPFSSTQTLPALQNCCCSVHFSTFQPSF